MSCIEPLLRFAYSLAKYDRALEGGDVASAACDVVDSFAELARKCKSYLDAVELPLKLAGLGMSIDVKGSLLCVEIETLADDLDDALSRLRERGLIVDLNPDVVVCSYLSEPRYVEVVNLAKFVARAVGMGRSASNALREYVSSLAEHRVQSHI